MAKKWRHDDDYDDDEWSEGLSDDDDSLDDDSDDFDDGSDVDGSDDEDSPTIECRMCGCDVYEDAPQCPVCGEWIERTPRIWAGRPWWWVWLGMIGIIAVIWSLLFGAI